MTEKKQGGTTATSIRISTTNFHRLRRIAENDNRSLSSLINHIADLYIFEVQRNNPQLLNKKEL